jgi:hypothetical protein
MASANMFIWNPFFSSMSIYKALPDIFYGVKFSGKNYDNMLPWKFDNIILITMLSWYHDNFIIITPDIMLQLSCYSDNDIIIIL